MGAHSKRHKAAAPKKPKGAALPLSLNAEVDPNESQVSAAAAAWLVLPATDGTGNGEQSRQDANQDANAETARRARARCLGMRLF